MHMHIYYMHAAPSTLKQLDTVYHSAVRFITGDHFRTRHCNLYQAVGWPSLTSRRIQHLLLHVYKTVLQKLPSYLSSLITWSSVYYQTRCHVWLVLDVPYVRTKLDKTAYGYCAPTAWNAFQETVKLYCLVSLGHFKFLLKSLKGEICTCCEY